LRDADLKDEVYLRLASQHDLELWRDRCAWVEDLGRARKTVPRWTQEVANDANTIDVREQEDRGGVPIGAQLAVRRSDAHHSQPTLDRDLVVV
jgi:hypothetical protein